MLELLLLALALAADAFAVSITIGSTHKDYSKQQFLNMALLIGLYFGVAQGVMPLLGYALGVILVGWLAEWSFWIAFILSYHFCLFF